VDLRNREYLITDDLSIAVGIHSITLCYSSSVKRSRVVFVSEWSVRYHDIFGMNCLLQKFVTTTLISILMTWLQNGCTAQDIAEQLNFDDIIDALKSKSNLELGKILLYLTFHVIISPVTHQFFNCFLLYPTDPTVPMFKEWLNHLGGGEYAAKFIEAGYDLPFIAKHGVTAEDLDCVGIPSSKMGLRRKISTLHELSQFYEADADEEEEEEEDGEEDEEEEDA